MIALHCMVWFLMWLILLILTYAGRISSLRTAGSRLVFIDIIEGGQLVQGLCNFRRLEGSRLTIEAFKDTFRELQRGDVVRKCQTGRRTFEGIPTEPIAQDYGVHLTEALRENSRSSSTSCPHCFLPAFILCRRTSRTQRLEYATVT